MATKSVKFDSASGGTYSINVDHPLVEMGVGDKIKFKNRLTGDPLMTIEFFVVEGDTKSNADGLCKDVSGNILTIAGGKNRDCKIEYDGYIKYDVSAGNHADLDPVVIIDKTVSPGFILSGIEGVVTLGLVAVVAIVIGYMLGNRQRSNA